MTCGEGHTPRSSLRKDVIFYELDGCPGRGNPARRPATSSRCVRLECDARHHHPRSGCRGGREQEPKKKRKKKKKTLSAHPNSQKYQTPAPTEHHCARANVNRDTRLASNVRCRAKRDPAGWFRVLRSTPSREVSLPRGATPPRRYTRARPPVSSRADRHTFPARTGSEGLFFPPVWF